MIQIASIGILLAGLGLGIYATYIGHKLGINRFMYGYSPMESQASCRHEGLFRTCSYGRSDII